MKYTEYDDKTLKHLQNTELMILKDFIEICEDNNLDYYIYGGSLIGAIRHKGFIPWDDDLDVIMFREDYDKFKKIFNESYNDKYYLLCKETEEDYFYLFSKLVLKGTIFEEEWVNQVNFNLGINIDIFVLDDLSDNKIKRYIQLKKAFFYSKIIIMSKIKVPNLSFIPRTITNIIQLFLKLFNIKPADIQKRYSKFIMKYHNPDAKDVFDVSVTVEEYPQIFNKKGFKPIQKAQFEDIMVNIPNNYDEILTSIYGDYMKLPPKEDRYNHITRQIDFGKY
ncbi:MAG: LicD family protein [Methanobrevibacter thaueri]|nr:LicD family protein [Methanobrevibacter thaueri]